MTYGLLTTGFSAKRLADIKLEVEESCRGIYGTNVDVSPAEPLGQLIGILSEREALLWELAEAVYSAGYRDGASGVSLDRVVALAGIVRREATHTVVTLTGAGTAATVIPAGSVVSIDDTGERFATDEELILPGSVTATAEEEGAIVALAGTVWAIETPVAGWTGATNATDADPGLVRETDAQLRLRHAQTMRAGPGSSADSIRASLLALDGVSEAVVIENENIGPNAAGQPGKSFQAVVRDGDAQEIVDAIWAGKPAGIETYGSSSGTAVDAAGNGHTVYWTEPDPIEVWIEIDVEVDTDPEGVSSFPADGEAEIEAAILAFAATLKIGQNVSAWKLKRVIETEGIEDLTIRIGLADPPTTDATVVIAQTELAVLDSSRITVVRTN